MEKKQTIAGRNLVVEALNSGISFDKVFINQNMSGLFEHSLRKSCAEKIIPLVRVPEEKLNKMFRGNHQGIVAYVSPIKFYELSSFIPWLFEQGKSPFLLVLDGVTDVGNFGAIARSALAFGVDGIVLSAKKSAACNEDAIRSSAGALLKIPVMRTSSVMSAMDELKSLGITTYATDVKGTATMRETDFQSPAALVLGSENRGVSREILALSDHSFSIKQSESIDSLNVSVAAGIILHHIFVGIK